jgi:hypothetical protein
MNSDVFKGYYKSLDKALDIINIEKVYAFVFCRRENVHTVTIVLHNHSIEEQKIIDQLAGFEIPKHLYLTADDNENTVGLIGLDLTEENQDYLRIYVSDKSSRRNINETSFLYGVGYYLNKNGEVLGKKDYNANLETRSLDIDYYDSNNNKINHDGESIADPENYEIWGGSKELFGAVKNAGFKYNIASKNKKDQGYFLVDPNRFF